MRYEFCVEFEEAVKRIVATIKTYPELLALRIHYLHGTCQFDQLGFSLLQLFAKLAVDALFYGRFSYLLSCRI